MGRIHRLSDELVNQIAAGEVVERPASVVKELAENAVDAGATTVRVKLARGGLDAIVVVDDGCGMSREDAVLSLERHATSKLRDADGLFQIVTKGFRGEALPSIASVSRFSLTTAEPGALVGTRLSVEGGGPPVVEDAAPPRGTRLEVLDLFFNVPARRKFLKREATELLHCEEAVSRLALAHAEVGFFLEHDGAALISSPATADPKERIGALLGAEVLPHLLTVEERRLGVTVTGFIASPEFTLPTARALYTFVNRRYVRDRGVNSAVQRAFQDALPPGRQPVTVLHLELDGRAVDVNVHPQKLEVRFADPRAVQEALAAAIGRALRAAPWRAGTALATQEVHAQYAAAVDRFLARAAEPGAFLAPTPAPTVEEGARLPFGTARPTLEDGPPAGYFGALRFIGELGRRFWLCEDPAGTLLVLDPRGVRERLTRQALLERLRDGSLEAASPALFSATLELPGQAEALVAQRAPLARLGVELEAFGGYTVAVRRVPAELEGLGPALAPLLVDLATRLGGVEPDLEAALADAVELMAAAVAQAEASPRAVGHDEAHRSLARLDRCDFARPLRGGRLIVREVPLLDLEASARR